MVEEESGVMKEIQRGIWIESQLELILVPLYSFDILTSEASDKSETDLSDSAV